MVTETLVDEVELSTQPLNIIIYDIYRP